MPASDLRPELKWLASGFLMTFFSGFGQTYFIALFAGELMSELSLTDGQFGSLYTAGTLASAVVAAMKAGTRLLTPDGEIRFEATDWMARIGMDGEQVVIESQAYTFVEAWLERDKLMSGETAQFGYQLDFGDGPGQVVMNIAVTGAVAYAKAGQPQILQLDEEGRAIFTDTINALEGTPAGAPFAIIPTFTAAQ